MCSLLAIFVCLLAIGPISAQTIVKRPTFKQTNPPDREPQYFPVGLFSSFPELSELHARWYASELSDLEEPTLRGKIMPPTVYRFLLIPPVTPSLVVRLTVNPEGTGNLLAKLGTKRSRKTAPEPQTLSVSAEQVSEFLSLLRQAQFWSLPTARYEESTIRFTDAKEWLLEANKSGKYHVIDRSDERIEVNVYRACDYLTVDLP
jgi:hypothetical protein